MSKEVAKKYASSLADLIRRPVNKTTGCITPVNGALFPARRNPRLALHQPPVAMVPPTDRETASAYVDNLPDPKKISKLPPIPKINRSVEKRDSNVPNPNKRKRENAREERRKRREKETPKESERPTAKESPAQASSPDKNFDIKKSISIIMSQAKEYLNDGQLDENQYNTLMYQVLQLNERLKLYDAKQRELLEISKRKLNYAIPDAHHKVIGPKYSTSERNNFGDIDERVTPSVFMKSPPDSQGLQHSDMRVVPNCDGVDGPKHGLLPLPPPMPMYGPYPPMWRGQQRPRDDFGARRYRGQMPPYFRGKFDKRPPRPPFVESPRMPIPPLPTPKIGVKTPSPENHLGLAMLASVMRSSVVEASTSEYSLAEPLFSKPNKIPDLEIPLEEKPPNPPLALPMNINVHDLFAKLVSSGIVQVPSEPKTENKEEKVEEVKQKPREDKNLIHQVDLMKPETLRVKQPGLVSRLYSGMQCSGCDARFPQEQTVRYSQHLDWHFRQNRRDKLVQIVTLHCFYELVCVIYECLHVST